MRYGTQYVVRSRDVVTMKIGSHGYILHEYGAPLCGASLATEKLRYSKPQKFTLIPSPRADRLFHLLLTFSHSLVLLFLSFRLEGKKCHWEGKGLVRGTEKDGERKKYYWEGGGFDWEDKITNESKKVSLREKKINNCEGKKYDRDGNSATKSDDNVKFCKFLQRFSHHHQPGEVRQRIHVCLDREIHTHTLQYGSRLRFGGKNTTIYVLRFI